MVSAKVRETCGSIRSWKLPSEFAEAMCSSYQRVLSQPRVLTSCTKASRDPRTVLRNDAGQGKRRGDWVYTRVMKRVAHRYPLLTRIDAPADLRRPPIA